MKELSIEEKAKRYDEAIERAKNYYSTTDSASVIKLIGLIFPELKESEDEKIRKAIHIYLDWLDGKKDYAPRGEYTINDMIDWIEKQGKHQKFRDSIQVGDKVTRNEDGVLVNLSQLNRVAKKQGKQETICDKCRKEQPSHSCQDITELGRCALEKQGEQKPAWSEKDDEMLDSIIEEVSYIGDFPDYPTKEENKLHDECLAKVDWLKSLKERHTWKPSEEQIKALEHFVRSVGESGYSSPYDNDTKLLYSLLEQLKKLKA